MSQDVVLQQEIEERRAACMLKDVATAEFCEQYARARPQ
jgi:hypothetical protein